MNERARINIPGLVFAICIFAFIHTADCKAQTTDFVWSNLFGGSGNDTAFSIQITGDKGCVFAGFTDSCDCDISYKPSGKDFLVVKYSMDGKIQWHKVFGGPQDDVAHAVIVQNDGGYVVAGSTACNEAAYGYKNCNDIFIARLDSGGEIISRQCFGGSGEDIAASMELTSDGGYIVAGFTDSVGGDISAPLGGVDAWLLKFSPGGVLEWERTIGTERDDQAFDVFPTSDGGYVMTGRTASDSGELEDTWGLGNLMAARLDSSGEIIWQKEYGGIDEDCGHSVMQLNDGGFIIAGMTRSFGGHVSGHHGGSDVWLLRLDSEGNLLWSKCYGGTCDDIAHNIRSTTDGGFIIIGETSSFAFDGDVNATHGRSDVWIVKTDATGNMSWQKTLGGKYGDAGYDIRQTVEGYFLAVGKATSGGGGMVNGGHGSYDAWIFKIFPSH